MIKINLLPYREMQKKAGLERKIFFISGFAVCFLLLIGLIHLQMTMSINKLEKEVKFAQDRLNILTKVTGDLEKFKNNKELLEQKIQVIKSLEKDRMVPVHILDEFTEKIPAGQIWITSLSEKGEDMRLEGMAVSNPAIALFMNGLEKSHYVKSVDLVSSKQIIISDVKLMHFMLSCKMKKG